MGMGRTIKVVMIGASGTGKTSLRGQYISGTFTTSYRATIGTDFHAKTIPIRKDTPARHEEDDDDEELEHVSLQIWDTAGQERFSSLSTAFFRGADAVILVYDVARPDTLEDLKRWWGTFCDKCPVPPGEEGTWPVVVVGNKIDLLRGGERPEDTAVVFLKGLIPVQEDDEEEEDRTPTPTPKINGGLLIPNGNAHPLEVSGARSSVATGNTIYHTPSSSLHTREGSSSTTASTITRHTIASTSTITPTSTPDQRTTSPQRATSPPPPPPDKGPKLFFSSAKTSEGVTDIFSYIAQRTIRRMNWLATIDPPPSMFGDDTLGATNHDRLNLLDNLSMSKLHDRCCA